MSSAVIFFDQVDKKYRPGETVSGRIHIFLDRDVDTCLNVLVGGAATATIETTNDPVVYMAVQKNLREGEDGQNRILRAGRHCYNFSAEIPADAVPSFEGIHGSIRYGVLLKAEGPHIPWKLAEKTFEVNLPSLTADDSLVETKKRSILARNRFNIQQGTLEVEMSFQKISVDGQPKDVFQIKMQNDTNTVLNSIKYTIFKVVHYHPSSAHQHHLICSESCCDELKILVSSEKEEFRVGGRCEGLVRIDFDKFKDLVSFRSELLDVNYYISFKIYRYGLLNKPIHITYSLGRCQSTKGEEEKSVAPEEPSDSPSFFIQHF